MKCLLLPYSLLVIGVGQISARVTKFAFTEKVNALGTFIRQKNTPGESNAFSVLDIMMASQINYVNSNIMFMMKKYSAGTTKSSPDPNSPQMIAARNEGKRAALELNTITLFKNNQETERALYNKILPLKRNIPGSTTTLLNYLNQFAATLQ